MSSNHGDLFFVHTHLEGRTLGPVRQSKDHTCAGAEKAFFFKKDDFYLLYKTITIRLYRFYIKYEIIRVQYIYDVFFHVETYSIELKSPIIYKRNVQE